MNSCFLGSQWIFCAKPIIYSKSILNISNWILLVLLDAEVFGLYHEKNVSRLQFLCFVLCSTSPYSERHWRRELVLSCSLGEHPVARASQMLLGLWHHSEFTVSQRKMIPVLQELWGACGWNLREGAYFSSSSSMKPLLSWSMMAKAFLISSADLAARPTLAKNSLYLKESAAVERWTEGGYSTNAGCGVFCRGCSFCM